MNSGNKNIVYDVVITGGGPAGGTAAYFAAKQGMKVLLIEKEKLPRDKTCGGGLIFKSIDLLPFDLTEIIEKKFYGAVVFVQDIGKKFIAESSKPVICNVMRSNFDNFILKKAVKAGAEVLDSIEILSVENSNSYVEVKSKNKVFRGKYLIGADGATGITRKFVDKNSLLKIPALESEIFVDKEKFEELSVLPRFDFGFVPGGYAWVFPKKNHLSVGVLSAGKGINLHNCYRNYLDLLGIDNPVSEEKHGYFIPIQIKNNSIVKGRVLLSGDSAGLADPLIFEGISHAILSGKLAAGIIKKHFEFPDKVSELYLKQIKNKIFYENKFAATIASLIYKRPKIRSFLFKWKGEKFTDLVTDVSLGDKKYSQLLKSPVNYLKLLK